MVRPKEEVPEFPPIVPGYKANAFTFGKCRSLYRHIREVPPGQTTHPIRGRVVMLDVQGQYARDRAGFQIIW